MQENGEGTGGGNKDNGSASYANYRPSIECVIGDARDRRVDGDEILWSTSIGE